jgi:protein-disulfide isomerase
MALFGALANAVVLVFALMYPLTDDAKKPAARRNLLLLSGLIAATSLLMGGISAFILKAGCPFCILTYVLSFVTFGTLWMSLPADHRATPDAKFRPTELMPLAIAGVVMFFIALVANDQFKGSYGAQDMSAIIRDSVQEWQSASPRPIQTIEPLAKGAAAENAKMTIVEFADFRCVHCEHAAPVMRAFIASHPDVRLEFQAWPLDGECNSAISRANGASCLLARTVYCAEKTGKKGWQAHDYVYSHREDFESVEAVRAKLPEIAQAVGLGGDQLIACADSSETKATVERQAGVGTSLNLQGTPTIFVNGKQLKGGQLLPVLSEAYRVSTEK